MAGCKRLGWRTLAVCLLLVASSPILRAVDSPSSLTVTLEWDPNPEPDLSGYHIYRSQTAGGGYVRLNATPQLETAFTDTGLVAGVTYYYVCTAVNSAGFESAFSNEVSVAPADPTNTAPQANADLLSLPEDGSAPVDVLANDVDPDGDALSIVGFSQAAFGSVALSGNGLAYTPFADFNGNDSFTYEISDGRGATATAAVSVSVLPVNDPPVAAPDAVAISGVEAVSIPVLENDSDIDGDPLTVLSVSGAQGTVTHDGAVLAYSPAPDFSGIDTFTYTVGDGNGGTADGTVTVDVSNQPPQAVDDEVSIDEDTALAIDVLVNDIEPDGDPLTITGFTQPAEGVVVHESGRLRYTPPLDFNGTENFQYSIADGRGGSSSATVVVEVQPVNDPPRPSKDQIRLCRRKCGNSKGKDTVEASTGSVALDVLANDSDPDGDVLTVESVSGAQGGTAAPSPSGDRIHYMPNSSFSGVETLTYTVTDGQGGVASSTVRITVDVENRAPVAQDDWSTTRSGHSVVINLIFNDHDPDNDFFEVVSVSAASGGAVGIVDDGSVRFTADKRFVGNASFRYTVSDGELEASATVRVDVNEAASADLFFPYSVSSQAGGPLDSSMVGVAVVNLGLSDEIVTLSSMSRSGAEMERHQLPVPLVPRAQRSFLAGEVASSLSEPASLGIRSSGGLHGFFSVVDDEVTRLDAVGSRPAPGRRLYFHQLRHRADRSSVISLFNPSVEVAEITVRLYSQEGELIAEEKPVLAPHGSMRGSLLEIFDDLQEFDEAYARLDSNVGIEGFAIHADNNTYTAEAAQGYERTQELVAGHFYFNAPRGDRSRLRLLNPGGASVQAQVEAYDSRANLLAMDSFTLQAGELLAGDIDDLLDFGPVADTEVSGYLRVRVFSFLGGRPGLIGSMEYSIFEGQAATSLPLRQAGPQQILFPHLAQTPDGSIFTGMALVNPLDVRATARVEAYDAAGALSARRDVQLEAGEQLVDVLTSDRLFGPDFVQIGGHLEIVADSPIIGLALIGSPGGFLSAIEGQSFSGSQP